MAGITVLYEEQAETRNDNKRRKPEQREASNNAKLIEDDAENT